MFVFTIFTLDFLTLERIARWPRWLRRTTRYLGCSSQDGMNVWDLWESGNLTRPGAELLEEAVQKNCLPSILTWLAVLVVFSSVAMPPIALVFYPSLFFSVGYLSMALCAGGDLLLIARILISPRYPTDASLYYKNLVEVCDLLGIKPEEYALLEWQNKLRSRAEDILTDMAHAVSVAEKVRGEYPSIGKKADRVHAELREELESALQTFQNMGIVSEDTGLGRYFDRAASVYS